MTYLRTPTAPYDVRVRTGIGRQADDAAGTNASDLIITTLGKNEQQVVTLGGHVTGGHFHLTYSGQTTGTIAFNADATTVKAALVALSNIAPDDLIVTGDAGGPWTIEFIGAFARSDVALMTSDASALTGAAPGVTVAEARKGVAGVDEQQTVTVTNGPTGGTFTLTYDGEATGNLAYNIAGANLQTALEGLTTLGAGNVTVAGDGPYVVTFTGTLENTDVALLVADAALLTRTAAGVTIATTRGGVAPVNEKQTATLTAGPTGGDFTLTFDGQTTAAIAFNAADSDVVTALENLSNLEPGDVAVVKSGSGTGGDPTVFEVTFQGTKAGTNVAEMTSNGAGLTGPGSPYTVTIATTRAGVVAVDEQQSVTLTGGPNGGTYTLTVGAAGTTAAIPYNATAAALTAALEGIAGVGAGNVLAAGDAGGPYTVTFQASLGGTDITEMTADAALLTVPTPGVTVAQSRAAVTPVDEQQSVTLTGWPAGGAFTLSYGGQTTAAIPYNAASSAVQTALIDLSSIPAGEAAVTGSAGGPWTVTFSGTLGGADLAMMTSNAAGLTAPTRTCTVTVGQTIVQDRHVPSTRYVRSTDATQPLVLEVEQGGKTYYAPVPVKDATHHVAITSLAWSWQAPGSGAGAGASMANPPARGAGVQR